MDKSDLVEEFWQSYLDWLPADAARPDTWEAWYFSDNETTADKLAALVMAGIKRATASLQWAYEWQELPVPRPGDMSVIVNWAGEPQCVIQTTAVEVVPFNQVEAAFAAAEGEGDGSLDYWRRVHWEAFSRECAQIGREPNPEMPVVCEHFRLVYPGQGSSTA